tara:strand:+ start:93 stop:278 length:186 start_codon:yes stop_codon:yes gene_type:complete
VNANPANPITSPAAGFIGAFLIYRKVDKVMQPGFGDDFSRVRLFPSRLDSDGNDLGNQFLA